MSLQAADLFAAGSLVLHAPTGIVGRVKTVWEAGEYFFARLPTIGDGIGIQEIPIPFESEPCKYPVVELSTGDRFVLRPDEPGALRALTEAEARCYAEVLLPFMMAAARSAKSIAKAQEDAALKARGVRDPLPPEARSVGALFMAAARAALIESGIKLPGAEP